MNGYATSLSVLTLAGAIALLIAANGPRGHQEIESQSQQAAPAARAVNKAATVSAKQESPSKREALHAYHKDAPKGPLPATLDPQAVVNQLLQPKDAPTVIVIYSVAAKIKDALYQVPCYCGCDKSGGHESLLDCFTTFHGVGCGTCQMEVIYVFEQVKGGKKPTEIRDAMERGEWGGDVADYVQKHYPEYAKVENGQRPDKE